MLQPLMLTFSANFDDLTVGLSYGLREENFSLRDIIIIALISGLTMSGGLLLGQNFSGYFAPKIGSLIAAMVFFILGFRFIYQERSRREKKWQVVYKKINKKEESSLPGIIKLGFALGINSIFLGFSGGLAGFPVAVTGIFTFICSFIFLFFGNHLGERISGLLGQYSNYVAGLILILMGIKELIL
ncbi:MAG: manganese efflux pump MntP family protein [Halanaerobiaceae bacterium]